MASGDDDRGPIETLHKLVDTIETLLVLDSTALAEYKPMILKVKKFIQKLQANQSAFASQSSSPTPHILVGTPFDQLNPEQIVDYERLKAEKQALQLETEQIDVQLFTLLSQLRRLQFTIDSIDPTAYQQV